MVVFQLARALTDIGHQVRVLGPSGFFTHRKVKFAFPVHRWPKLFGLFPEQIAGMSLSADLRLWGADVIHAHNTYPKKTDKSVGIGKKDVPIKLGSVEINPGDWIYIDSNGWIISKKKLEL